MKRDAIVEAAKRYMAMRTVEPLTINQLLSVLGGNRAAFYRAMRAALADASSGIVAIVEHTKRGGARRVWTTHQAADRGLDFVRGEEASNHA